MLKLVFREARYRPLSFGLGLAVVLVAATLYVGMATLSRASDAETKRLMRDLGFNLLVLPEGTDMAEFWAEGYSSGEMPEEYVKTLASTPGIYADHYVATLQKSIDWHGRTALLTGILPEQTAVDARRKAKMGVRNLDFEIERGTCYVGNALATALDLRPRQMIEIEGREFKIERCLLEDGSKQDITIYANLADVQEVLSMEGRINAIQCLGCLCAGATLDAVREQVGAVLPDTGVFELRNVANARSKMRQMMEEHSELFLSIALLASVLWVAGLAFINVRDRAAEVGILRALGFGPIKVCGLFLGRAGLMGLIGGVVGFAVGTWLATSYGPAIYKITSANGVKPDFALLTHAAIGAPLVAMAASLIPAIIASRQDPARVLMED